MQKRKTPSSKLRDLDAPIDLHQRWLARLKANPLIAAMIIAVTAGTVVLAFAEKVVTLPQTLQRLVSTPHVSFEAGIYLWQLANIPSPTDLGVLIEEIQDLSSSCGILLNKLEPNAKGVWASPGPLGARANVLLKIRLGNNFAEKLTNLKLTLSPAKWPIEFSTLTSTPNISVKLARSARDLANRATYIISIDSLAAEDFGILTLSAPLLRKDVSQLQIDQFNMMVLSIQADQFPTAMPKVAQGKSSPMTLFAQEGLKMTGGLGFGFGSDIELLPKEARARPDDTLFLPQAKQCDLQPGAASSWAR